MAPLTNLFELFSLNLIYRISRKIDFFSGVTCQSSWQGLPTIKNYPKRNDGEHYDKDKYFI